MNNPAAIAISFGETLALILRLIPGKSNPIPTPISTSTQDFPKSPPRWKPYFEAAPKCQEQIKRSTEEAKESFAKKCSLVLDELRRETLEKICQSSYHPLSPPSRVPVHENSSSKVGVEQNTVEENNPLANGGVLANSEAFFDGGWSGWV